MFMSAGRVPAAVRVPPLDFERRASDAPPDDVGERTIVFLDCGNIDRMPVDFLQADGLHILNIDHHHDNTRFGTVNLVVPDASCTAEIVWRAREGAGGRDHAARSPTRSTSALVTDTGSFMYENTTRRGPPDGGRADRARAWTSHDVYRRLYEDLPFGRLAAACSARWRASSATTTARSRHPPHARRLRGDGRAGDRLRGRRRPHARRRGHQGRRARARAAVRRPRRACARSACARPTAASTCRGSRASSAAAGTAGRRLLHASSRYEELVEQLRAAGPRTALTRATVAQSGVLLYPKPAGVTSHDVVAVVRRRLSARRAAGEGRPRGHARPVRHRPAAGAGGRAPRARSAS